MFENLKPQPADKILALMQMYREDPRDQKIDLGVGVYKNAEGVTPVMRAVKAAEKRILEEQESKAYTGLAGDPAYADAMIGLILDDAVPRTRLVHLRAVVTGVPAEHHHHLLARLREHGEHLGHR